MEIWIAQGVYRPTQRLDAGDPRSATFLVDANIRLLGGFSGVETSATERDRFAHPVTLSGDLAGNDGLGFANRGENAYHVLRVLNNVSGVELSGLGVRSGNADPGTNQAGGGLFAESGVILRDCDFIDNQARSSGGGANIICSTFQVIGCRFLGNSSDGNVNNSTDGGLRIDGLPGVTGTIADCVFAGNLGQYGGGGLGITGSGVSARVTNCTFFHNAAPSGNGGAARDACTGSVVFSNCIVWDNGATAVFNEPPGSATSVVYSDVEPGTLYPSGCATCNFSGEPRFANRNGPDGRSGTADDDLTLLVDSPCVDAGDNTSALAAGLGADALGHRRFHAERVAGVIRVDVGAYEFGAPPYSPVLFVRGARFGAGDGSSWADAIGGSLGLREALDTVAALPGVYSAIWVAAGTYRPGPALSQGGSRSATFLFPSNLSIYGGFDGTETLPDQRNIPANPAVLSGDLNGNDSATGTLTDNSLHVVTVAPQAGPGTILDGLTVTGGNADGGPGNDTGGGLLIDFAGPVIRNCTFTGNHAAAGGRAVEIRDGDSPDGQPARFQGCTFVGNPQGAVSIINGAHRPMRPRFEGCGFTDNRLLMPDGVTPDNGHSGAAVTVDESDLVLSGCVFRRNSAFEAGALRAARGGRITLNACSFLFNSGFGTVYATGAGTNVSASNCVFSGNFGPPTGGHAVFGDSGSSVALINCTITGSVSTVDGAGVATRDASVPLVLSNCILWGNSGPSALSVEQQQVRTEFPGNLTLRSCTVQGWSGILGGTGCNGADPLLTRLPSAGVDGVPGTTDDDDGDARLLLTSPALNSADPALLPPDTYDLDGDGDTLGPVKTDAAGSPRVFPLNSLLLDRGAYERQGDCPLCPGPRRWENPTGGSFDNAANWSPSAPDQQHECVFGIGYAYSVLLPPGGVSRTVPSATVSAGAVTLNLNQGTLHLSATQAESLTVGNSPTSPTSLSITQGTLVAVNARVASVGIADPSDLNRGPLHRLEVTTGGQLICSRSLTIGAEGNGRMDILSGGHVTSRDATIGDQPGSSGYVSVSGAGSTWDIPFFCIIDNGELNVSGGGVVNVGTGIPFTGVFILNDGRISGDGVINGNVVNFGSISPGNSPGTLTINGGYAQVGQIQNLGAFSGSLNMEIAGSAASQYDRLVVNATADGASTVKLGGGLFVRLAPGYQPGPSDSFRIIDAGQNPIDSQFDVIFFPALTAPAVSGKFLRADYSGLRGPGGSRVTVNIAALPVTGGFNPPQATPLSGAPSAAALGDLNGDGFMDLAVALPNGSGTGSIAILFNDGAGNFAATQISSQGVDPSAVAIADISGDGRSDLVIANAGSDQVRILRQQAAPGSFADPSPIVIQLPAGSSPVALAAGDFDRDTDAAHRIDLAIANSGGASDTGSITVARNTPNNPFSSPRTIPMPPQKKPTSITPCNPDQDKDLDLAVGSTNSGRTTGSVSVFVNAGSTGLFNPPPPGLMEPAVSLAVGAEPLEIAAGRLATLPGPVDEAGQDLVTVNRAGQSVSILRNTTVGNDQPSFAPAVEYAVPGYDPTQPAPSNPPAADPRSLALADLDNDGDLDIAVIATSGSTPARVIKVLRNDSPPLAAGQTRRQVAFAPVADRPSGPCAERVLAGEVTGDGRVDLVTVNGSCLRGPGGTGSVNLNKNNLPPLSVSVGACCAPVTTQDASGACSLLTVGECAAAGGAFRGPLTTCSPSPCPFGNTACCRGATCAVVTLSTTCTGANTQVVGPNTVCNAPGNRTSPCCLADFNHSGLISVQDIFDFLAAYFAGVPGTDINQSGATSVQDIFDFLAAYITGC